MKKERSVVAKKKKEQAEDQVLGEWVYCSQHLNVHLSGWCTVPLRDKLGIGPVKDRAEAIKKCLSMGLKLYEGTK